MWLSYLFIFILFSFVRGKSRLDPLVATTQGFIKGLKTDEDYAIFLGIPYAKVDENNPFGAAIAYPMFKNVFEAYDDPLPCPQIENGEAIGSLDCLRLNVFVPNSTSSIEKLPVIVWIHGGAFNAGYTKKYKFGAKPLIKHNVIVVTLNYRLGPYGFFCLDTPEVPGNQGIKDQLLAMRWVKANIESFGGDADKITVMGESAGSITAELHILSKQEKLFDKAILMSGSCLKPKGVIKSDLTVPLDISKELGFETDDLSKALSFLSKEDPKLVVAVASNFIMRLRPCIEKEFENVESIITEHPYNLDVPKVRGMDILAGFNNREGLMTDAKSLPNYFQSPQYFPSTLGQIFEYDEDFKEMEDIVRHFYIGDVDLTEEVRGAFIDFDSDLFFNYPTQWSSNVYLRNGARNVYQYLFSYDGGLNTLKKDWNITLEGAAHSDELGYLFDMTDKIETPSAQDQLVIDRITKLWTNFAKYGNPTPEVTDLLPLTWKPITDDIIHYMNIDTELSTRTRPFSDRLAFWELFFKANQQRLQGYRHH